MKRALVFAVLIGPILILACTKQQPLVDAVAIKRESAKRSITEGPALFDRYWMASGRMELYSHDSLVADIPLVEWHGPGHMYREESMLVAISLDNSADPDTSMPRAYPVASGACLDTSWSQCGSGPMEYDVSADSAVIEMLLSGSGYPESDRGRFEIAYGGLEEYSEKVCHKIVITDTATEREYIQFFDILSFLEIGRIVPCANGGPIAVTYLEYREVNGAYVPGLELREFMGDDVVSRYSRESIVVDTVFPITMFMPHDSVTRHPVGYDALKESDLWYEDDQ